MLNGNERLNMILPILIEKPEPNLINNFKKVRVSSAFVSQLSAEEAIIPLVIHTPSHIFLDLKEEIYFSSNDCEDPDPICRSTRIRSAMKM